MCKLIKEEKACEYCGKLFYYEGYTVKKCCSRKCAQALVGIKNKTSSVQYCQRCGEVFTGRGKFCSDECRRLYGLSNRTGDVRICLACGKEFKAASHSSTKFCSISCVKDYLAKHVNPFNNAAPKVKFTIKVCQVCGKEFEVWGYRNYTAKFCSKECHYSSKPKVQLVCALCGKEFEVQNHRKEARFCSKQCATESGRISRNAYSKAELEIKSYLESAAYCAESEVKIHHSNGYYVPDIVVGRKIIEYYGTFWHCDPLVYAADYYNKAISMTAQQKWDFDSSRIATMQEAGYTILIVWEREFKEDKELVLSRCINFLEGKETYA